MSPISPKISTHLGYFGTGADRYNPGGYVKATPALERIKRAAEVDGLDGVELNYPALVSEETLEATKTALKASGLTISSVSLNVWGSAQWGLGALSHPEAAVRAEGVRVMQRGMEVAKELGTNLVSLWPGQDGFDYPFQIDYGAAFDRLMDCLREVAAFDPGMRICLEYKPKEPRTHLLLDTAARTMWLIGKVGAPNIGVLLDLGHAFYANENVAQSAVLLARDGLLDLIHFNDNYGEWDWDMIPGTVRFWELIELIFWLRELKYDKWYSIDIFSPRWDPVKACQQSVTNIRRLVLLTERLDREAILANLMRSGFPDNLPLVSDAVFGALTG